MKTTTPKEDRTLGLMISFCEYPSEGPELLLSKSNFCRCGKLPTAAVARSGNLERTEVLHLVVVRVQQCVARVSLSSHEESSPPRVVPSMVFHQSCNARHIVGVWAVSSSGHGHYVDDLVGLAGG